MTLYHNKLSHSSIELDQGLIEWLKASVTRNLVLNWVTPQSNLIKAWLNDSNAILPNKLSHSTIELDQGLIEMTLYHNKLSHSTIELDQGLIECLYHNKLSHSTIEFDQDWIE